MNRNSILAIGIPPVGCGGSAESRFLEAGLKVRVFLQVVGWCQLIQRAVQALCANMSDTTLFEKADEGWEEELVELEREDVSYFD